MAIFWAVFFGAGTLGLAAGLTMVRDGLRARRWPAADGRVVASGVSQESDPNHGRTTFAAAVVYAYSVGGQTYEGREISSGEGRSSNRQAAVRLAEAYPAGAPVRVFYDPGDAARRAPARRVRARRGARLRGGGGARLARRHRRLAAREPAPGLRRR